jgi:glyoxylase-like metal-dependent hydrolase (beta-lactamase superfamily II)
MATRTYRKQEQEPASTDVTELAPGIIRTQLPIQMPGLGHVNMYVLLDDAGAAVIDPGLPGPFTWKAIDDRLRQLGLKVRNVHTVIVTHSHPDHFGSAGRLAQEANASLIAHDLFPDWWSKDASEPEDHIDDADAARRHNPFEDPVPWGGDRMRPPLKARLMRKLGRVGFKLFVPPHPSHRAVDGDVLHLAGRAWQAVHTPGHTLDHLCLYDPDHGVLLSGDHVLPTITPHIAGVGAGPDPLASFVTSLDRVVAFEDVQLVLPAHGHPFTDLPGRVEAIKRHHVERCNKLREISLAIGPATVEELSQQLFRKVSWGAGAQSETYAHLEHLRIRGEAHREERAGKPVYTVTP